MSRLFAACSIICADQPATRPEQKVGEYSVRGMSIVRNTPAAQNSKLGYNFLSGLYSASNLVATFSTYKLSLNNWFHQQIV